MTKTRQKSFWTLLVEEGLISAQMLREASQRVKEKGGHLEAHLVDLGLDDEAFARFISSRFRIPLTLLEDPPDPNVLGLIPREAAQAFWMVPFAVEEGKVFVAMANPLHEEAYLELDRLTDRTPVIFVAPLSKIRGVLAQYPERPSAEGMVARFSLRPSWGTPYHQDLEGIQPLPVQEEAHKAMAHLRKTPPSILIVRAPSGSGRTFLSVAWGHSLDRERVRWVDGKAVYNRWVRLRRRGYEDMVVDLLAQPAHLVVDVPYGEGTLWEEILRERSQRGVRSTVVVSDFPEGELGEFLEGYPQVLLGTPGEEDAEALVRIYHIEMPQTILRTAFRMSRGHLRRFLGLLDSLRAAVQGDWSKVTPELLRRFASKQGG